GWLIHQGYLWIDHKCHGQLQDLLLATTEVAGHGGPAGSEDREPLVHRLYVAGHVLVPPDERAHLQVLPYGQFREVGPPLGDKHQAPPPAIYPWHAGGVPPPAPHPPP